MTRIALIQQHAVQNRANNIDRGIKALERAAAEGAAIIGFAELAFDYFLPQHNATSEALQQAQTVPGPATSIFAEKARKLGVVIILNLFEEDEGRTYDCSPVIDSTGEIAGKTRMVHIFDGPCFHEKEFYTPGNLGAGVFDTTAGKIGIAICYDRHFPEYMRALAVKGAEVVVIPQAGAAGEWPEGIFEGEVAMASFHNGYFCALANRVGKEDVLEFAGGSFVTDPLGRVISRAPAEEDHILFADMDFSLIRESPARKYFLADRRTDIYGSGSF